VCIPQPGDRPTATGVDDLLRGIRGQTVAHGGDLDNSATGDAEVDRAVGRGAVADAHEPGRSQEQARLV
jgi:hypothetical protein